MTLQYLTDKKGLREFVQIQIPIRKWEMADKKFVIEKDTEDELDSLTADDYRNYFLKRGKKMLAKALPLFFEYQPSPLLLHYLHRFEPAACFVRKQNPILASGITTDIERLGHFLIIGLAFGIFGSSLFYADSIRTHFFGQTVAIFKSAA